MTPLFWVKLMVQAFNTSERFACRLWRYVDASPTMLFQLSLCDTTDVPRQTWLARLVRLSELLSPAMLIEASVRLHPENGRPRPREHITFEAVVLAFTDQHGAWKW
jgi:hypothetical protein